MGIFSAIANAAKESVRQAKKKYEIAYNEGLNFYDYMKDSPVQRDIESLELCLTKFEKLKEKDYIMASGYYKAAMQIISNTETITDDVLKDAYTRCEWANRKYAIKMILQPQMLKRGILEKDASGRIVKPF